jgi:FlaA1/EpsC-like NDP-sugar epimerase
MLRIFEFWALVLADITIVMVAPFIAIFIRFDGSLDGYFYYHEVMHQYMLLFTIVSLVNFYYFGLYHRLWRYAGIGEVLAIVGATTVSTVISMVMMYAMELNVPRSTYVLTWLITIVLIGNSRLLTRFVYHLRKKRDKSQTRTLVVGAGDAGAIITREIRERYYDSKRLIGFIDDAPHKQNQLLFGIRVLGTRMDLLRIVKKYWVDEIIIAIPSLDGSQLREIVDFCKQSQCIVRTVPGIYESMDGSVSVEQLREIKLEDLLHRKQVRLDMDQIAEYLEGKRVLVTGAGGSIGSELCRQIANFSPNELVLLGRGENSIYEIDRELREKYPNLNLIPVIADINNQDRIKAIFNQMRPQVVFHAAAHKHVPLMEAQPEEAVRNNIFGTKTVAEAAEEAGTEMFVLLSTDKAVNPTSIMGATKQLAELIIQGMNQKGKTKFMAVRFGNVLGSRGSVVPLFKKQIAAGGAVTVTHPEMKRYFMTIPEAVQLVLQAGTLSKGGEIFVLDMGEPVKIVDMARDLIRLSGFVPDKEIEIKFTGIRPGEKLFEELLTAEEGTAATKHEKIFITNLKRVNEAKLQNVLSVLMATNNFLEIRTWLKEMVPTYCDKKTIG